MAVDKRAAILRILDDQNRLVERADTKAISLLSTLGIFTVFFIAQFRSIPISAAIDRAGLHLFRGGPVIHNPYHHGYQSENSVYAGERAESICG